MSTLLGIALVVDDINKGCNLAFRYPAPSASLDFVSSFHKISAQLIAKLFRPKNALCNQSFELVMDDLRFISHPVLVSKRRVARLSQQRAGCPEASRVHENETTMFNIIFALDDASLPFEEQEESSHQRKQSLEAYRTVAAQLANALLHEEIRSAFVSREVRQLLHIREELIQNERSVSAVNGSNGSNSRKDAESESVEIDPQTLIDVSLGKSVLANDLKSVFHGLEEVGSVHVVINRWVKLSLTVGESETLTSQNIRPYQTLLLLKDEDKILNALPSDHAHQLRVLINGANPLKSFQELALETSVPLQQLFRFSAHLVHWGFGRIIDTITMHNIYQVSQEASLRSQSTLALEFRRKFAPHELCEVLSSFSGTRRIGEYLKHLSSPKKIEYIHMLIWLLQHHFIVQLHRYVYFIIPSDDGDHPEVDDEESSNEEDHGAFADQASDDDPVDSDDSQEECSNEDSEEYFNSDSSTTTGGDVTGVPPHWPPPSPEYSPSLTVSPSALLNAQETRYLERIATTNPVFTLFKRLCVYFHGQYHLEEIMWRENVSRKQYFSQSDHSVEVIVNMCSHVKAVDPTASSLLGEALECRLKKLKSMQVAEEQRMLCERFRVGSGASKQRALDQEPCACLHCSFCGVLDASSAHKSFMKHSILNSHPVGILLRYKTLYCAACGNCVYHEPLSDEMECQRKTPNVSAAVVGQLPKKGLLNLGNTCFMNCVLQTLIHNPIIIKFFLSGRHTSANCGRKKREELTAIGHQVLCLGCEMDILIKEVAASSKDNQPIIPHRILYAVWQFAHHLAGYQQQDAHEFLIALLGGIHSHTHKQVFLGGASPRIGARGRSLCDCIVHQVFSGVLRSDLTCQSCGSVSMAYDPFFDLSLSLEETTNCSIHELLQAFTSKEVLRKQEQVYCRQCEAYRDCTKRMSFFELPNVLCFHLKRLDYLNQNKNTSFISFPATGLDLTNYRTGGALESIEKNSVSSCSGLYDLMAVVNHHGSVKSGHYTSFVKSVEDATEWFLLDDAQVSPVKENEVLQSEAYLLIYLRRSPEPPNDVTETPIPLADPLNGSTETQDASDGMPELPSTPPPPPPLSPLVSSQSSPLASSAASSPPPPPPPLPSPPLSPES